MKFLGNITIYKTLTSIEWDMNHEFITFELNKLAKDSAIVITT